MAKTDDVTQANGDEEGTGPSASRGQRDDNSTSPIEDQDKNGKPTNGEELVNQEVLDGLMPTAEHATELIVDKVKEGAKAVASATSNIAATVIDKVGGAAAAVVDKVEGAAATVVEKVEGAAAADDKDSPLGPYSSPISSAPSDMDPVAQAVCLGLDINGDAEIRNN